MILAALRNPFIQFPGGAKWSIGFLGIFHVAVGSLAIGFAFIVTVLQLVAYFRKDNRYDLLAKRVQLWHVCIYNIGTINAIGLVFALSGLYPQFWSQIFTQFFWTLVVEETLFFMLATTLTFHYFFWDHMWGHKKLHIFMGSLLTPFFFLQFFIINGMGAYMLTPAFAKGQASLWSGTRGILGWDMLAFYNPSFLMLTLHRTAANFAYAGFRRRRGLRSAALPCQTGQDSRLVRERRAAGVQVRVHELSDVAYHRLLLCLGAQVPR